MAGFAPVFDQSWGLDGLGNFGTFDDDGTSQSRTANAVNEITNITGGWRFRRFRGHDPIMEE
jgi:hypothetical protein